MVLVEDDEDIRVVAEKALRGSGYEVFSAKDGESGLQLVKEKRPDLVILDLMMPRMHGFTVCQAVRSDPSLRHIAILVSSAKSYPVDVARARELGADYYLMKPYDIQELLLSVKTLAGDRSQVVVKFWGTRGSLPTPGAATLRYGGNTACVEVRDGDTIIMLDRGSQLNEFARKADLYIRDAQSTEEEYAARQGWGHSTWKDALESAHAAGVTQLALFHHDPGHDDAMMDGIVSSARQYMNECGMHFNCFAAADSMLVRI